MVAGDEGFLAAMCSSRRGRRFPRDRLGAKEASTTTAGRIYAATSPNGGMSPPPVLELPAEVAESVATDLPLGTLVRLVGAGNMSAGQGAVRERLDRLRVSTECPERP
jgi:hypothetical protein